MSVRVCGGKGGKDRYTLLSPSLLDQLRSYCYTHGLHHPRKTQVTGCFPTNSSMPPPP
ncbi:hypothetical protein BLL52_4071 [Rhodoferax antarcticus ANT.BR]|uniref:Uncharacterized protein n=1 Tax=Rhodoferax antarcticus ANT.BR TaxID=1111071 RepID=A0A1Q8YA71_9BURK|nr:hypothetical protein BLL52_4071 [Rhodoferax antarcticus ANT.BR]